MNERAIQRMEWMARAADAEASDPAMLRRETGTDSSAAYILGVKNAAEDFRAAAHALRAQGPLVEALESVQHCVTPEGADIGLCPSCGVSEIRPHHDHCRIGAALALAKERS